MGQNCSTLNGQNQVQDDLKPMDDIDDVNNQVTKPKRVKENRRGSVSAEVFNQEAGLDPPKTVVLKDNSQRDRIRASIAYSVLLKELEEEQQEDIVEAVFEKAAKADEEIITQGQQGDYFYLIENGEFIAIVDGQQKFTYKGQGSFGELALLYNGPRQATVKAVTDGVLWAVDRQTFQQIVLGGMIQKRQKYEKILQDMPIFSGLSQEKRSTIADCLVGETYQPGDYIIKEGDELQVNQNFFIIESGSVECYKTFQGERKLVSTIKEGGFFGEYALICNEPRQADCIAKEKTRILTMGRDAFERLMGNIEVILAEKIEEYRKYNADEQSNII